MSCAPARLSLHEFKAPVVQSLHSLVISGDISRILTASGKGNNVYYQLNDYI